MKKELLQYIKSLLTLQKNEDKHIVDTLKRLLEQEKFYLDLLQYSCNDIETFCYNLGNIISYYIMTRDIKYDYTAEEVLYKYATLEEMDNQTTRSNVIDNGFFTHSCNGNMLEMIMKNGLGSTKNFDEKLFSSLNYLENILNCQSYVKQQSGRKDEVYFTSPGVTSVGYACLFSPERLFLGILKQDREDSIPVKVGENKKNYYRRVLNSKFENISEEIKEHIEIVLNGYFNSQNAIVFFPISTIINSQNIYFETLHTHIENLTEYITRNCYHEFDFFTKDIGSNSNTNNMDNLLMINEIVPSEQLRYIQIPDRYDLIQTISKIKKLPLGAEINYFTGKQMQKERQK